METTNSGFIKTPFINLQSDFGFKRAFGSERFRNALIKFLDAVLGDEITVTDVRFHDKEVLPSSVEGKRIVYDIYCTMDVPSEQTGFSSNYPRLGESAESVSHHFILEMQNIYEPPFEERMVYYAFRPHPTKNVKARAVYFRGNFVYLGGSNAGIVTGDMDEIHRKDTGQRILLYRIWSHEVKESINVPQQQEMKYYHRTAAAPRLRPFGSVA